LTARRIGVPSWFCAMCRCQSDAQSLARHGLVSLKGQLQRALGALKMAVETRAHLTESISRIDETLAAHMHRTAF
jgi:hypothetical protein